MRLCFSLEHLIDHFALLPCEDCVGRICSFCGQPAGRTRWHSVLDSNRMHETHSFDSGFLISIRLHKWIIRITHTADDLSTGQHHHLWLLQLWEWWTSAWVKVHITVMTDHVELNRDVIFLSVRLPPLNSCYEVLNNMMCKYSSFLHLHNLNLDGTIHSP